MNNRFSQRIAFLSFVVLFFVLSYQHTYAATITAPTVVPCRADNTECWPAAFSFTPNGRIVYAERYTGQIRIYNQKTDTDKLWASLKNISTDGEQGVLGVALDPAWPESKWVYVYYTRSEPFENRVIRLRKTKNGTIRRQLLLSIPASSNHNGGVIHFGQDGKLYIATGDTYDAEKAQDVSSTLGKILRINKNGSIPNDNPFGDSPVYSFGHRNSFGFTFNPHASETQLWLTENGPECNDELNIVTGGQNFGWGVEQSCPDTNQSGTDRVAAAYTWENVIAPTGIVFCDHCHLGFGDEDSKTLLMGAWGTNAIYKITTNNERTSVENVSLIYQNGSGILAVDTNAHGRPYFSDPYGIYKLIKE